QRLRGVAGAAPREFQQRGDRRENGSHAGGVRGFLHGDGLGAVHALIGGKIEDEGIGGGRGGVQPQAAEAGLQGGGQSEFHGDLALAATAEQQGQRRGGGARLEGVGRDEAGGEGGFAIDRHFADGGAVKGQRNIGPLAAEHLHG